MKNKIFTIPNILSFFRLALIPFIVWMLLIGQNIVAMILVVLSALTDVVDGYVARRFNQITPLGKALDPIADKLTLLAVLICTALTNQTVLALLIIFVVKEFIMGIEGLVILKLTGTTYSALWYGKASTVLLYASLLVHIVWVDISPVVSTVLVSLCNAMVLFSLIMYTIHNVKRIVSIKKQQNQQ